MNYIKIWINARPIKISHSYFSHYIENGILTISISHSVCGMRMRPYGQHHIGTHFILCYVWYSIYLLLHTTFYYIFISLEWNNDSVADCSEKHQCWLNGGGLIELRRTQIHTKQKNKKKNHLFLSVAVFCLMLKQNVDASNAWIAHRSFNVPFNLLVAVALTAATMAGHIYVYVWFVEAIQIKWWIWAHGS